MLKVLVVDDELIQRTGLADIFRRIRPTYQIFEATNGKDALVLVSSSNIDIIVTDVRMPIMDGLRFVEEIHRLSYKAKIIILTGYRNFEYVQKALRLGAFDYILKPMKEETIISMLEKVESSIEHDAAKILEKEKMIKQLGSSLPVYFEHIMNNWISGHISEQETEEIKQIVSNNSSFISTGVVLVTYINEYNALTTNNNNQYISEVKNDMKYLIKKSLDNVGHSISFFLKENKNTMVTVITSNDSMDISLPCNIQQLYKYIENLKSLYGINVIVGIGTIFHDLFSDIKSSYSCANLAVAFFFYHQSNRIIYFTDIHESIKEKCLDITKSEDALKETVKQTKNDLVKSIINDIFTKIVENSYPLPNQLIKVVTHMTLNIAAIIKDLIDEEYYNGLVNDIERQLRQCETEQALKGKVIEFLESFIYFFENSKLKMHKLTMDKCIQYIEEHFNEDISLESVASEFYFSPSYFSLLFKNQTGVVFSRYLSQLRIKKALELLNNSDYKVYEIASKVGYKDDKYFYRVFKKEFGVTPDEYRRIL